MIPTRQILDAQTWDAMAWITVGNASVVGNDKAWRQFEFGSKVKAGLKAGISTAFTRTFS